MRMIFYAEPTSYEAALNYKTVPDEESNGALWVTPEELISIVQATPVPGLRGPELLDWANYLQNGG